MAKRRPPRITLDAFLEAVEDAAGFEEDVLLALEVKARELMAWLGNNPEARPAARALLLERELDLESYRLGWLKDPEPSQGSETDANWAFYKSLLEEEVTILAHDHLDAAKTRTSELIARLQAEKRARAEQKPASRFQTTEPDEE